MVYSRLLRLKLGYSVKQNQPNKNKLKTASTSPCIVPVLLGTASSFMGHHLPLGVKLLQCSLKIKISTKQGLRVNFKLIWSNLHTYCTQIKSFLLQCPWVILTYLILYVIMSIKTNLVHMWLTTTKPPVREEK